MLLVGSPSQLETPFGLSPPFTDSANFRRYADSDAISSTSYCQWNHHIGTGYATADIAVRLVKVVTRRFEMSVFKTSYYMSFVSAWLCVVPELIAQSQSGVFTVFALQ